MMIPCMTAMVLLAAGVTVVVVAGLPQVLCLELAHPKAAVRATARVALQHLLLQQVRGPPPPPLSPGCSPPVESLPSAAAKQQ